MTNSNRDSYAHGYGDSTSRVLGERSAAKNAAFLLPHLESGMKLIDIGSGQGNITIGLAEAVSPGEAVGIEIEPSQVEIARENASKAGASNLSFEVADAYELPFDDAHFNAAFIHTVLEHVSEPVRVLNEVRRVLAPDGVIGIRHGERGAFPVVVPPNATVEKFLHRNGNPLVDPGMDTRIGRKQQRMLREAGFDRVETRVAANPDPAGILLYAELIEQRIPNFVDQGIFSAEEFADDEYIDETVAEMRAWASDPDAQWINAPWWESLGWKRS